MITACTCNEYTPFVISTQFGYGGTTNPPATNPTNPTNPNPGNGAQPVEAPAPAPNPQPPPMDTQPPEPEPNWVVRVGKATASQLQNGWKEHTGMRGTFGCSVQYQPGLSVDALATAGKYPHPTISYAADEALIAAGQAVGYSVSFVKSPGKGYHHTMTATVSATGQVVEVLPSDLAEALSAVFQQKSNPAPVTR